MKLTMPLTQTILATQNALDSETTARIPLETRGLTLGKKSLPSAVPFRNDLRSDRDFLRDLRAATIDWFSHIGMPLGKMGRFSVVQILPSRRWPPTINELHEQCESHSVAEIEP
jgi:hypothetical protein